MRSIGHWTARYILDRSRNILLNRLHPEWPWLTPGAIGFLNLWLRPADDVFEWGSGRSTIWIAQRVHSITSVETSEDWFARGRSAVQRRRLQNVDLRFFARSGAGGGAGAYASLVRDGGRPFDTILVDGLYRDHCALAATECLRPGGLLLIDNANWYLPSASRAPGSCRHEDGPASPLWAHFAETVSAWRQIWTSNGVTDTAIWIKTP